MAELTKSNSGAVRAARGIFTLGAIGEIGAGLLVALLPGAVMGFLLGAPLDSTGTVAARMIGITLAALGVTWWVARKSPDARRLYESAGGFLIYNFGVGLLFLVHAATADRGLPVAWIVAAAHLLLGAAYLVAVLRLPSAARAGDPRRV
jgi:hypothetical protein